MSQVVIFNKVAACTSQPVAFNPFCKKYASLTSIFLEDLQNLALNLAIPCKSCTKNEGFLARYKESCKIFAKKL